MRVRKEIEKSSREVVVCIARRSPYCASITAHSPVNKRVSRLFTGTIYSAARSLLGKLIWDQICRAASWKAAVNTDYRSVA